MSSSRDVSSLSPRDLIPHWIYMLRMTFSLVIGESVCKRFSNNHRASPGHGNTDFQFWFDFGAREGGFLGTRFQDWKVLNKLSRKNSLASEDRKANANTQDHCYRASG